MKNCKKAAPPCPKMEPFPNDPITTLVKRMALFRGSFLGPQLQATYISFMTSSCRVFGRARCFTYAGLRVYCSGFTVEGLRLRVWGA